MREFTPPLISLGSPASTIPDAADISRWIQHIKGNTADLITYQLHSSLQAQIPHAAEPAAGGGFYRPRIEEFLGVDEGKVQQDFLMEISAIHDDLHAVKIKHAGFSLPAFSTLDLTDSYLFDEDEFLAAGVEAYKRLCRELRDAGANRTILLSENPTDTELEALHGRKYLWATPAKSLERVLEVSRDVVVDAADVSRLLELADSYDMRYVYVRDADAEAIQQVLLEFDKEYVFVAGYGDGEEYWKDLAGLKVRVGEE